MPTTDRNISQLLPHPRLYAKRADLGRLKLSPNTAVLRAADKTMRAEAEAGLHTTAIDYDTTKHNSLLVRARHMQKRIVSLAVMWWKTGDERYHQAILDNIRAMGYWEYWSWITMRTGDSNPNAIFDLSYGENSATLAIAYDWLYTSLTPDEKEMFVDIARQRAIGPFLHLTDAEKKPWWFGRPDSNWNSVCAGGAGMLALAMREELPEAEEVLQHAEISIAPFMYELDKTSGGWVEGIGYWNYGMRYAFMYLLSWENATGQRHPLLALESVRATLQFPLDFTPNGQACGFGDTNSWSPLPIHYAIATRQEDQQVLSGLEAALDKVPLENGYQPRSAWPSAAELLIFHPRNVLRSIGKRKFGIVKLYEGLGWGILADYLPQPNFYLSARGGNTDVPHSHRDLMSFNCVVGDEKLIENIGGGKYLDTTFSSRRNEIFEITPASKNTLLINGVGITVGSAAQTDLVEDDEVKGIRINATEAMGTMHDGPAVSLCERTFLLLHNGIFLIVDRIVAPHPALVEARIFTPHEVVTQEHSAQVTSEKETLQIAFASSQPAVLQSTQPLLTWPQAKRRTMLRWVASELNTDIVFATLLTPGKPGIVPVTVEIVTGKSGTEQMIVVRGEGIQQKINLSAFSTAAPKSTFVHARCVT